MKSLSIDIETYSDIDLAKAGVYRYCESPAFEVLLFGYSADGGEVKTVDLAGGEKLPPCILDALTDPGCIKWAFNAGFERICLSRYLGLPQGQYLSPEAWRCTMVWSATLGLPLSLAGVGAVLGLEKQKLEAGKDLIRYFCRPCPPTKENGGRTRNLPQDAPEKWELFKKYNIRDVEAEQAIQIKLARFPVPEHVWQEYQIDQKINDTGVAIDKDLVEKAIEMDAISKAELMEKMKALTALENPNSVQQLQQWLAQHGVEAETLGKKAVAELMKTVPEEIREVLSLRLQLAKSSVKKYRAMQDAVCADGRVRGTFQFYGASRTGRWSGRLIQLQNLPQNHLEDLDGARELVKSGNYAAMKAAYGDVPDTLSQLLRTAFIARPGSRFLVADYSAIEARVISFLAEEWWRIDAFEQGKDIYCASASSMFHVPCEKHGVNAELRVKGKIAELALGYGGGEGALIAMGALDMGLKEEELPGLVTAWRNANPAIVRFWWDVDRAAVDTVAHQLPGKVKGIGFECQSGMLFITLPSGRRLAYVKPKIGENKFGSACITYEGVGSTKKWERLETYGPKLVENIVQATARDLLANAMRNLPGARIVMHIHDELVIEAGKDRSLSDVCRAMAAAPSWLQGIPLRADGYETPFYKKD